MLFGMSAICCDVPDIGTETVSDPLMLSDHSGDFPAEERRCSRAVHHCADAWSLLRGIRIHAVASEQSLQLGNLLA